MPPSPAPYFQHWTVFASTANDDVLQAKTHAYGTHEAVWNWCGQLAEANPGLIFLPMPKPSTDPRLANGPWVTANVHELGA